MTLLVVIVAGMLGGCAGNGYDGPLGSSGMPRASDPGAISASQFGAIVNAPYRIQPGDQLAIGFFGSPDLDQKVTVQPDGAITLPLLGSRRVSDLTLPELSKILQKLYASELRQPEVTLQLVEPARTAVLVGGAVQNAGEVEYRRGMSLLDAILSAGGLQDDALKTSVIVIRKQPNGAKRHKRINLTRLIQNGGRDEVYLLPWDVIYVPGGKGV